MDAIEDVMNYDPNLVACGRSAIHTIRLTFGTWDYRKQEVIDVRGNCKGLSVIDAAVGFVYDALPTDPNLYNTPYIILTKDDGGTLRIEDDDDSEDFLRDLLIGAEIISIVPEPDRREKKE